MLKGYKTVLFNVVQIGLGIGLLFGVDASTVVNPDEVSNALCSEMPALAGGALTASGLINVGLRIFTNTSIFKKE